MSCQKRSGNSGVANIIVLLGLAAATVVLPLLTKFVQQRQEIRKEAKDCWHAPQNQCPSDYDWGGDCSIAQDGSKNCCCKKKGQPTTPPNDGRKENECGGRQWQCNCNSQGSKKCFSDKQYHCGNDCCWHYDPSKADNSQCTAPTSQPTSRPTGRPASSTPNPNATCSSLGGYCQASECNSQVQTNYGQRSDCDFDHYCCKRKTDFTPVPCRSNGSACTTDSDCCNGNCAISDDRGGASDYTCQNAPANTPTLGQPTAPPETCASVSGTCRTAYSCQEWENDIGKRSCETGKTCCVSNSSYEPTITPIPACTCNGQAIGSFRCTADNSSRQQCLETNDNVCEWRTYSCSAGCEYGTCKPTPIPTDTPRPTNTPRPTSTPIPCTCINHTMQGGCDSIMLNKPCNITPSPTRFPSSTPRPTNTPVPHECVTPDDCPAKSGYQLTGCTGSPRKCNYVLKTPTVTLTPGPTIPTADPACIGKSSGDCCGGTSICLSTTVGKLTCHACPTGQYCTSGQGCKEELAITRIEITPAGTEIVNTNSLGGLTTEYDMNTRNQFGYTPTEEELDPFLYAGYGALGAGLLGGAALEAVLPTLGFVGYQALTAGPVGAYLALQAVAAEQIASLPSSVQTGIQVVGVASDLIGTYHGLQAIARNPSSPEAAMTVAAQQTGVLYEAAKQTGQLIDDLDERLTAQLLVDPAINISEQNFYGIGNDWSINSQGKFIGQEHLSSDMVPWFEPDDWRERENWRRALTAVQKGGVRVELSVDEKVEMLLRGEGAEAMTVGLYYPGQDKIMVKTNVVENQGGKFPMYNARLSTLAHEAHHHEFYGLYPDNRDTVMYLYQTEISSRMVEARYAPWVAGGAQDAISMAEAMLLHNGASEQVYRDVLVKVFGYSPKRISKMPFIRGK